MPVVLSIYLSLYTAIGPRGHSRQGGRFSLHVIMLLKIPVNSKAHVRMHTCDIFLRVFFMYLFGMWDTSEREWEHKLLSIHQLSETVFFKISLF